MGQKYKINMKGLTPAIAKDFLKKHEKEQSEKCFKEINESLKKYSRKMEVINSIHEGAIRNQIILTKLT